MRQWLTRFILARDDVRLVRVKSWKPWRGPYGIEWPVLLIDDAGQRVTAVPVWDRYRVLGMWRWLTNEPD